MGGNRYGAERIRASYGELNTDLKFNKTGKEIQESIQKRLNVLGKDIEERQSKMAEVCKNRDVELKEVLEAGDDHERIESYSNKMSSSIGNVGTKTVLEALQKDINFLRTSSSYIWQTRKTIEHLERVTRNIAADSKNELHYDELILFGF